MLQLKKFKIGKVIANINFVHRRKFTLGSIIDYKTHFSLYNV